MWSFIFLSTFFAIRHMKLFAKEIIGIAPHAFLGLVFALGLSASFTLSEVYLGDNLSILGKNIYQLLRNCFFGTVGSVLLIVAREPRPVGSWEETLRFFKQSPRYLLPVIIIGQVFYSVFVFWVFAPAALTGSKLALERYVSNLAAFSLAAVSEELLFRLFLIALMVYILQKAKYRWIVAILLSAIYWAILHNEFYELGWIKVLQIMPLGVVLGVLMKKYGLEACVLTHVLTNIVTLTVFQFVF